MPDAVKIVVLANINVIDKLRFALPGFCRDDLMSWCETNQVHYVFGLARNERLRKSIDAEMAQARALHEQTQQAVRVFTEFVYETHDSWSRARRVVAKAEHLSKGENPRFVVTSLDAAYLPAQPLYEQLYCGRGEMENRIKEQFSLFSDRTSTAICGRTNYGCTSLQSHTCCWKPFGDWV